MLTPLKITVIRAHARDSKTAWAYTVEREDGRSYACLIDKLAAYHSKKVTEWMTRNNPRAAHAEAELWARDMAQKYAQHQWEFEEAKFSTNPALYLAASKIEKPWWLKVL